MPKWTPQPIWQDQDAIVIGGGASLHSFPFEVLVPEYVIGCNAAYSLGKDVCSVVFFGDNTFFEKHEEGLKRYDGPVFTCSRRLYQSDAISWLRVVRRIPEGMAIDAVGWNGNTGAAAINLAFLFGCRRVFLLGFDMSEWQGRSHWHDLYPKDNVQDYPKFMRGFMMMADGWRRVFPDREIINVTDNSALELFLKMSVQDFLKRRTK
ncbi:MAG: hypothetical protein DRN14_03870 [Thermoplasmata archaeon]|nr:MAG: hypothetical protein DRN14_03870 [Thermoplasmata archaeon]